MECESWQAPSTRTRLYSLRCSDICDDATQAPHLRRSTTALGHCKTLSTGTPHLITKSHGHTSTPSHSAETVRTAA